MFDPRDFLLPGSRSEGDDIVGPGDASDSLRFAPRFAQRAREYTRQRQMGIGDLLLENRIVFLDGAINDGVANLVVMKLLFLQSENRHQDVHLYVNSPGGSVTATLAIYDTMQFLECDVRTYCVGLAASGGAILVCGGTPKKRYTLPHSKMMIHQPYGQVGGQVSDIEIQAKDILRDRNVINEIMARHTGQSIEVVARDTQRDRYLNAAEAKEYGLVDEILAKPVKGAKGDKPETPAPENSEPSA